MPDACPFCPPPEERVIHRGESAIVLWDGFPVSPGHVLIIPKRHVSGWFEATPDEIAEIVDLIPLARAAIERKHAPDGYNLGVNVGEVAGQTVFHLHLHVIPRYVGDSPDPRGGVRWIVPAKARYWTPDEG